MVTRTGLQQYMEFNLHYLYIKNYEIEMGRGFIPEDLQNSAKVTLIGSTVAEELFGRC